MTTQRESSPSLGLLVCPRCRRTYEPGKVFCSDDGARLADGLEPDALAATPMSAQGGYVISGRYVLGSLIGHGSMARVYTARDLESGQQVAVKILNRRYAKNAKYGRRFLQEARAALQIHHPSVVKVLDVGKCADGRPFLVTEQLHGETLGECLRRRGSLPPARVAWIAHEAAQALCSVHEAGVIHRDVKPDNIFLLGGIDSPMGVRIMDFGLAKLQKSASSQSNDVMGTAAYMAPEQVLAESSDARSDIYSLGVVMFRAITGHLPFAGRADLDLVAQQVLLPTPPPSWFVDGLDPRVDAVVLRALRKRPENRYPNMHSMVHDLTALQQGPDADLVKLDMIVAPDTYEPVTETGQAALAVLCRAIGAAGPSSVPPK